MILLIKEIFLIIDISGQRFFSHRIIYRTAAGAWCIGCFFLVQIYCSTLTSHLTAPNQKPIEDTVHELANTPDVSLMVDKGFGIDFILKVGYCQIILCPLHSKFAFSYENQSIGVGDFKLLADKFKRNPKLLCNVTTDCLNAVKGGNVAFGAVKFLISFLSLNRSLIFY